MAVQSIEPQMDKLEEFGPPNTEQSHSRRFKSLNENPVYKSYKIVIIALTLSDPLEDQAF